MWLYPARGILGQGESHCRSWLVGGPAWGLVRARIPDVAGHLSNSAVVWLTFSILAFASLSVGGTTFVHAGSVFACKG